MFGAKKKRQTYSAEMRRDVLAMADDGIGTRAIALELNVSESWVRRVKQEFRETGKTAPKKTRETKKCWQPHAEWLAAKVDETPDIYLHELQRAAAEERGWVAGLITFSRALRALGITRKKRRPSPPNATAPMSPHGEKNGPPASPGSTPTA